MLVRMLTTYDITRSWQDNLCFPSQAQQYPNPKPVPGNHTLCGLPVASPLGIVAGPLLNSDWVGHYGRLGFDWLVYKTVRSTARSCYPLPNLVPVHTSALSGPAESVPAADQMNGSWAVSFGMPSQSPDVWRSDVRVARQALGPRQLLVVSVVGSAPSESNDRAGLDVLADDFAQCAAWAVEAGADIVEANFSCPNVSTADGQLYQQPAAAAVVAQTIRQAIGNVPLILKIGFVAQQAAAEKLVEAVAESATALAMTNAISASVRSSDGTFLFDGQPRGICGAAIRDASCRQVERFQAAVRQVGCAMELVGVGGVRCADDVRAYLNAGARAVGLATAAMRDPLIGIRIRADWPDRVTDHS